MKLDARYLIPTALLLALYAFGAEQKTAALTFDDGPNPPYTGQVLKVLEEKKVRATFFMIGQQVEKFPDFGKQVQAAGHTIGGHSSDWEMLVFKRWSAVEAKLDQMDHAFTDAGITRTLRCSARRTACFRRDRKRKSRRVA